MNQEIFEKIKKEILEIIKNSRHSADYEHSVSTCELVLKLKDDADYALQIAALAHDVERAVFKDIKIKKHFEDYNKHKADHALRSADVIKDILLKYNLDEGFIYKVYNLVKNHEVGGDFEMNVLRDADSISYFKDNLNYYFGKYGLEGTKLKIKYMFDRVGSDAKIIIQNLKYENEELRKYIESLN